MEYTNVPLPVSHYYRRIFLLVTFHELAIGIRLQVSSDEEGEVKQPPLMMAALRVGGAPKIDPEQAIIDAVELAKSKDAVILVIGRPFHHFLAPKISAQPC